NTAGRADRCAHLVLGAGNQLRDDGKRTSKDSKGLYTRSRFLQILNERCTPLVNDLVYEEIKLQEITYGVLTLMPSTHVHYLAKNLETPGYTWPGGSALIRRGDQVGVASPPEIQELHEMIRKRQAARSQASESLQYQGPCYPGQLPALPPKLKADRKNTLRD